MTIPTRDTDQIPLSYSHDFDSGFSSQVEECSQIMGDELRRPLTSIQSALKILHSGQCGSFSQTGQRLLDIALKNTRRLVRLSLAIENQSTTARACLSPSNLARLRLENELEAALHHQELQLYYQPIVAFETQDIIGFEALTRWYHPTRGWISPNEFIPIAETMGLIDDLGLWVLEQACRQMVTWQQQFSQASSLTMSVNLSTLQLSNPRLPKQIETILEQTHLKPQNLRLEITESAFLDHSPLALKCLQKLKAMGILLYIDDFGTGYSSLSRLQDWPIDVIKIDNTFVRSQQWTMIQAIMLLAESLNVDVIVEGIETPEDLTQLQQLGCQQGQGYLFSKPLPAQLMSAQLACHCSSQLSG
jgi:EAL domain-containing protein (putative c-di-GMP-specific phosphodiesterase class I)